MKKIKLVYRDANTTKVLWGQIIGEDEVFISFLTEDGNTFRINKQQIISIKNFGGQDE